MKFKRSERLIDMTAYFYDHPHQTISLNYFTERYSSAKSSISEDIDILKDTFKHQDIGIIKTQTGASGGVVFLPYISKEKREEYVDEIINELNKKERILPGGYLFLTDIIGNPRLLKKIGKIIASDYTEKKVDYILTVATKGISLAQSAGYLLNVPIVFARKDSKVTEGPTVSVKYTSESAPRLVQSMELSRDAIASKSEVVLIDDFYRGGGTMSAMESLVEIFDSHVAGSYVLCENIEEDGRESNVKSLITIEGLDINSAKLTIKRGNIFD